MPLVLQATKCCVTIDIIVTKVFQQHTMSANANTGQADIKKVESVESFPRDEAHRFAQISVSLALSHGNSLSLSLSL